MRDINTQPRDNFSPLQVPSVQQKAFDHYIDYVQRHILKKHIQKLDDCAQKAEQKIDDCAQKAEQKLKTKVD